MSTLVTTGSVRHIDLGRMPFAEAWQAQREWHERIVHGKRGNGEHLPGVLLLVEHPHVFTLGRVTDAANVLFDDTTLAALGAETFEIDRGGDVTYHGPGQLVGYPILDLSLWREDLHWYLRALEEVVIRTIGRFGLHGDRVPGRTGVWVNDRKICAIGIKCSSWVTMHGFALNVAPDLSYFSHIVPCGIRDRAVTSMERELGAPPPMTDVRRVCEEEFDRVFAATANAA